MTQNVLLHRVQMQVFNVDEPTAAGRWGKDGSRAPGSACRNRDGAGLGYGVAWEPCGGHAQPRCQGRDGTGDRDEPALRGVRGG